jgi:hypothetical protein
MMGVGRWRLHLNTILGLMFNSLDTGKIAQDPTLECHSMKEHTLSIVKIKNTVCLCFIFGQNKQEFKKNKTLGSNT